MTTPTKHCTGCGRDLPATPAFFSRSRDKPDGFDTRCKECRHEYHRRWRERNKKRNRAEPEERPAMKQCSRCGQILPATAEYFTRVDSGLDGLTYCCKACRNRDRRQRYGNDPEYAQKCRARARAWFKAHPQQAHQQRQKQYAANREQAIKDARRWREEHPQQYKETQRKYKRRHYRANRETYRTYVRNRRAHLRKAQGEHTVRDIKRLYKKQGGKCYYCGASLAESYHVDHVIPLSRGGTNSPDNIVLTCPHCNLSKNDRLPSEWTQNPSQD